MKTFQEYLEENETAKDFVYIIYEKDGYDGQQVGKVFRNKIDAEKAIKNGGYFNDIEEHEVI